MNVMLRSAMNLRRNALITVLKGIPISCATLKAPSFTSLSALILMIVFITVVYTTVIVKSIVKYFFRCGGNYIVAIAPCLALAKIYSLCSLFCGVCELSNNEVNNHKGILADFTGAGLGT